MVCLTFPSGIRILCPYQNSSFDDSGALYWIGTNGKTVPYINPHSSGKIAAKMSSTFGFSSSPHKFVGHSADGCNHTQSVPNSWMLVDFGIHHRMLVTGYCLRSDAYRSGKMRNWKLQGKNDAGVWIDLITHENDTSLSNSPSSTAYWKLEGDSRTEMSYQCLRIFQHGVNSLNTHYLMCSGIEFFGTLIQKMKV